MSDTQPDAARFMALFAGSENAHGTHGEPHQEPGSLKWGITRTARTVREPVTLEMWLEHLTGKTPLGVIPIKGDSTCLWGSIDVDQYDMNLLELIQRVERGKLPLVPCRSKSGGLHLFLFFSEWTAAELVHPMLKSIAASLGLTGPKTEIFPKQTQLASAQDLGNWMIVPYFGGDYGGKLRQQVGLKKTGAEMTVGEFLSLAEASLVTPEIVATLRTKAMPRKAARTTGTSPGVAPEPDVPFGDGPPCLQTLAANGFPSGGRNSSLLMSGVYFKRAYPDDWKTRLEELNTTFSPPLASEEVANVVRSLARREYKYMCKTEPMASHCDSLTCRGKRFGVGEGSAIPLITSMRKFNSDPPIWFIDIEGSAIEVTTDQLFEYKAIQKICADKLTQGYGAMKQADWQHIVVEAMKHATIENVSGEDGENDPPDDEISPVGHFVELLQEYLTNRAQGERLEDLLSGRPWLDAEELIEPGEGQRYYFHLKEFEDFMKREKAPLAMTRPWVARRIRSLGGGRKFKDISGRPAQYWWVPKNTVQEKPRLALPKPTPEPI